MRVLVTGGTGFVGRAVFVALLAQGVRVRLLTRRRNAATRQNVDMVAGDIQDPESLAQAVQQMDAVVHLVGIISQHGKSTFEAVHTQGTKNVIAAARSAGVKRFVHMSALGTRADAVSNYHRTKWDAEEAVRTSGLKYTIFRPSLIYGPEDNFVNLYARIARLSPVVPLLGRADALFQPIGVGAVAEAFASSLSSDRSIGRQFDLCGPERMTLRQIVGCILEVLRKRRLVLHVPDPIAQVQARMLELVCGVVGIAPPLNRDQLVMLAEDNVGDPVPADELFRLKHRTFIEGISSYLQPTGGR